MRFMALCEGPGSMAFYLLHMFPRSRGQGYTRFTKACWNWHQGLVEHPRFSILCPKSEDIADDERVLAKQYGQDFVMADGGLGADGDTDTQETDALRLIAAEARIAVQILVPGGTFVLKIYNCLTRETTTVLWQLALAFERISITNTVAERPSNQERYVVCRNKRDMWDKEAKMTSEFIEFIRNSNNRSLDQQLEALRLINHAVFHDHHIPLAPTTAL